MGQAKKRKESGTYPVQTAKPVKYDRASFAITTSKYNSGYKKEHPLIDEKRIPEEVMRLARLLALPVNKDIYDFANKYKTIEKCLGAVAACLDIVLDGYYDVPPLCTLLADAVQAKMDGKKILSINPDLVSVQLTEREGTVALELALDNTHVTTAKDLVVAENNKFLLSVGCKICNHIALCRISARCLGNSDEVQDEAIDAAKGKEFLDS